MSLWFLQVGKPLPDQIFQNWAWPVPEGSLDMLEHLILDELVEWFGSSVQAIAQRFHMIENAVQATLSQGGRAPTARHCVCEWVTKLNGFEINSGRFVVSAKTRPVQKTDAVRKLSRVYGLRVSCNWLRLTNIYFLLASFLSSSGCLVCLVLRWIFWKF